MAIQAARGRAALRGPVAVARALRVLLTHSQPARASTVMTHPGPAGAGSSASTRMQAHPQSWPRRGSACAPSATPAF